MKRYSISWKNESTNCVEVIASTFTKAIDYCKKNIKGFVPDNVTSVYVYNDVLIAE